MVIERFGPVAKARGARSRQPRPAPVDAVVIDWVLTLCGDTVNRRRPLDERTTIPFAAGPFRYRCAIVPLSENGIDVDCLAGLLSTSVVSRR